MPERTAPAALVSIPLAMLVLLARASNIALSRPATVPLTDEERAAIEEFTLRVVLTIEWEVTHFDPVRTVHVFDR